MTNPENIAHSFLAILAGFITTVGLTGIGTLLTKVLPGKRHTTEPNLLTMAVHTFIGLASSLLGGYVTARAATTGPLAHILILALVVLLMSGLSAIDMKGRQPAYYLLITFIIPPLAVLGGGLLRLRQMGLHW